MGVWLHKQANTECERWLEKPIIALGVFLLIVSLMGLIGACCRVSWLLWFYLLFMFLLILLLFVFTIFAFIVTNEGAGEKLSNKGYKEYRLGDYSNWLQKGLMIMEIGIRLGVVYNLENFALNFILNFSMILLINSILNIYLLFSLDVVSLQTTVVLLM
jgi:hypothetical protein